MTTMPSLTPADILALPAVVPVWPTVGRIYGLSRNSAYALARDDDLPVPVFRAGRQLRARRIDIVRQLGLDDTPPPDTPAA